MGYAKAPSRGDKVTLTFGLVSIPVTLYNAVDESQGRISRHQRIDGGHEVGNQLYDKETGEVVDRADVYSAYDTEHGEVELTDDEIAAAMDLPGEWSEMLGIYPLPEADNFLVSGNYQVRPQSVKSGSKTTRPFDKAYALLMTALMDAGVFALVRYVSRGKPKLVGIFPDGTGRAFHWANEVREPLPQVEWAKIDVTSQERAMADKLVATLISEEAPVLENEPVEKVREYAEAKAKGQTPKVEKVRQEEAVDIMAALQASIEAVVK